MSPRPATRTERARAQARPGAAPRAGVTLLELLIVISLVSLLMGMGMGALARLDPGRRAAAGIVQSVLRTAANSAIAHQAPATVVIDPAARTIAARALQVVGTWHFESAHPDGTASLEGAFGLDGEIAGGVLVEDGELGRALSFAGGAPAWAEVPVERDAAFEFEEGFALGLAVRVEERGGASLVDVGGALGLELTSDGVLAAWFVTSTGEAGGERSRGARVTIESAPGALDVGVWRRVRASYDRRLFELALDGVVVASLPADAPVWVGAGPLVLGDQRRAFPGSIDTLAVSSVVASAALALPENVAFGADVPREIRFAPGGHLDRAVHAAPVVVELVYADNKRETVRVGLYGTVE